MSKEAMRLALEAVYETIIQWDEGGGKRSRRELARRIVALAEQPAQQEPDELRHIEEQDCLLDVDEKAWRSLVENRGGCRCHISPPCGACSNPISEEEMNEVGYTYTSPQPPQRTWVGLTNEERNKLWREVVGWGDPSHDDEDLMKAIEAKLREKNGITGEKK